MIRGLGARGAGGTEGLGAGYAFSKFGKLIGSLVAFIERRPTEVTAADAGAGAGRAPLPSEELDSDSFSIGWTLGPTGDEWPGGGSGFAVVYLYVAVVLCILVLVSPYGRETVTALVSRFNYGVGGGSPFCPPP